MLQVRCLGEVPYRDALEAMHQFTDARTDTTPDEIWLLQHPAVFTLGQNGDPAHILQASDISVIKSDRGGQVTYHGPGQLVIYVLMDTKRQRVGVSQLVHGLEATVIELLQHYGVTGTTKCQAPGVYVNEAKLCSVGLRLRRFCSFHGLALNVDLDLSPFELINPCGYVNQAVTHLRALGITRTVDDVARDWLPYFHRYFRYAAS
jgi:lipoyl(octanoyl) transferase